MELTKIIFHYFVRNYNAAETYREIKEIVRDRFVRMGILTQDEEKRLKLICDSKIS
jgi:hypothetical protein